MNKQTFKVSDESTNSHGFKIITSGIDTANFEKNPIMYYMHNRNLKVIGRWENIKKENNEMFADAIFDEDDPFAKEIAGKVKRGFLKAASIGIEIKKRDQSDSSTVVESELFEISIVDRGSNKNALRLYDNRKLFSLKFNEQLKLNNMNKMQQIALALDLKENVELKEILQTIEVLKNSVKKLKKTENDTAESMINTAVNLGVLAPGHTKSFLNLFASDFDNAKISLQSLINSSSKKVEKSAVLNDFLKGIGSQNVDNSGVKNKSEWTLTDYRKNAPKELMNNPQLYKQLIDKEFGETI